MERNVDILNELSKVSPLVAEAGWVNIFTVPQGYFELAPEIILACVRNQMAAGKDVPAGYFDDLSNNILCKIEGTATNELQGLSPFMAGIKKVNPFEVPINYFEQASIDITAQKEEVTIAAMLEGANKLHAFNVPAGYFDKLASNILNKVRAESGAKVIIMPKRRNAIFKYAAAAVFTGMAAMGVYKYTGNDALVTPTNKSATTVAVMDDKKFDETLNNLDEDDIMKYLEKNGSETDVVTLTSGIDENSLPSQEEYLTDEKALDNFIEDINLKN